MRRSHETPLQKSSCHGRLQPKTSFIVGGFRVSAVGYDSSQRANLRVWAHGNYCKLFLFERWNGNRVQMTMSRARIIVVSLIPVLLLVSAANCFSCPVSKGDGRNSLIFSGKQGKQDTATWENSPAQAARRWGRRVNMQPGAEECVSLATSSQSHFLLLDQTVDFDQIGHLTEGLAQCWQFQWRTALPPRAPSSVS